MEFLIRFSKSSLCSPTDAPVVCVSVWYGDMLYISIYISTVWTIFFILIVSVHYVNSSPVNGICQLKTSFQSVQHTEKKPIFSKPNMCMHLKYLFAVLIYSWFSHYLSHTIRKLSSVHCTLCKVHVSFKSSLFFKCATLLFSLTACNRQSYTIDAMAR